MELQSTQINELAAALAKAQGEMDLAGKTSDNPFFKSKYAKLDAIQRASRPALTKHGLSIVQGKAVEDGKELLITTLLHSSGQWIKSVSHIKPDKSGIQELGKHISYLLRYDYMSVTGCIVVDNVEDDDGGRPIEYISNQDIVDLKAALMGYGSIQEQLQKRYADINFIPVDKVDAIFEWIEKEKDKLS